VAFGPRIAASSSPNIIVVLADDLGYGDLGCYGNSEVHTPNLDQFATEGLRFTDCYSAAANCSPSRAGLMTGRTPWRLGIHNWIPMMSPMHVKETEITIATLLKGAGYDTCHVGKWHLNGMFNLPGQPQPNDHGFDHWFSIQNNALPNHRNPYNFVRNGIPVGPIEGYSAEIVTDEAIRWLETEEKTERPFFLFVCYSEPHEPVATAERHTQLYADKEDPAERALLGNITQLDEGFGRLMKAVDDLGLREDTLVLFTSDNGPAITGRHPYGSAAPLRAKKGYLREGGIRVPGLLRWPGVTSPDSVCKEPVSGVDLLPTLCAISNIAVPDDRAIDGTSWLPLFNDETLDRENPLYWHFLRAKGSVKVAIREGDWKLVARIDQPDLKPSGGITQEDIEYQTRAQLTDFSLYQLTSDIGETTDLKDTEAERFNAMKHTLVSMYEEVREESPIWPAWEFPRYEGGRIEWPEYQALIKPPVYEP
tara:strand:+ start:1032 stop:2468 length:1437 start_codon:yes stop_codon:yes gene_type:complete